VRQPTRPTHLSEHAERTLQALASAELGHAISLGGALGLLHYLDYRSTHDVDAWWAPSASPGDRERVVAVVEEILRGSGAVRIRRWGALKAITDPAQQADAERVRTWFTKEFLDAILD
jgi:hypothetical protein